MFSPLGTGQGIIIELDTSPGSSVGRSQTEGPKGGAHGRTRVARRRAFWAAVSVLSFFTGDGGSNRHFWQKEATLRPPALFSLPLIYYCLCLSLSQSSANHLPLFPLLREWLYVGEVFCPFQFSLLTVLEGCSGYACVYNCTQLSLISFSSSSSSSSILEILSSAFGSSWRHLRPPAASPQLSGTMDGGQGSGARGCIGQIPRRRLLPEGLPLLDREIDQLKQVHQGNERLHKEEVERLIAQFREEMEGIERKYEWLMAEKEAEYRHQIGNLEMNKNKVIQNRQLCEAWRLQPDPRVLRLGMSVVPTACAGSQRQTSCLQPYQTLPPPPACLSSASFYLNKVIDVANQRQAATSAVYHDTGMMQQNIDPQPVGQCIDMMPNYWLTSEAFLTSNFDQSWWWRRPQ